MRDYALLVILVSLVFLALYRPWLGVLGLAVLGFMHPQGYGESFIKTFPAYLVLFAATGIGYLAEQFRLKSWPRFHWDWRLGGLILLWGWFFVSTYYALAPFAAREKLVEVLKILPPLVLVWLLIDTREKLFLLMATIALSIALVVIKGGYWAVMTGFHDRVYGPPGSQYGDNNEFAVAVAMAIPLLFIWMRETQDKALRWMILALVVLSYLSALSSWSRGGMLSLIAMTLLLVWYSRRKFLAIPLVVLGILAVSVVFSEKWLGRMGSILSFGEDASAQSRMGIWRVGWEAAIKHPGVGSGFDSWPILSASNGGIMDWHSAYIELLAEHGFVGLAIWGGLVLGTVFGLGFLARSGRRTQQPWATTYAGMLQASLVAYLAGALTLGIAYWELPFWLIMCGAVAARLAKNHISGIRRDTLASGGSAGGVVFSALILSGYSSASFAAAYIFLKDTPLPSLPVPGIDLPGTLIVPENALGGTHPELAFSIPAPVTSQVFLLKPGTAGLPDECLDQGNQNRVGVGLDASGSPLVISAGAPNEAYVLTLSVNASATASSCVAGNPVPIRVASIAGAGIPGGAWTGTYDVYQANSVPEPGTLALLGLGLSALVFVKRRRAGRG